MDRPRLPASSSWTPDEVVQSLRSSATAGGDKDAISAIGDRLLRGDRRPYGIGDMLAHEEWTMVACMITELHREIHDRRSDAVRCGLADMIVDIASAHANPHVLMHSMRLVTPEASNHYNRGSRMPAPHALRLVDAALHRMECTSGPDRGVTANLLAAAADVIRDKSHTDVYAASGAISDASHRLERAHRLVATHGDDRALYACAQSAMNMGIWRNLSSYSSRNDSAEVASARAVATHIVSSLAAAIPGMAMDDLARVVGLLNHDHGPQDFSTTLRDACVERIYTDERIHDTTREAMTCCAAIRNAWSLQSRMAQRIGRDCLHGTQRDADVCRCLTLMSSTGLQEMARAAIQPEAADGSIARAERLLTWAHQVQPRATEPLIAKRLSELVGSIDGILLPTNAAGEAIRSSAWEPLLSWQVTVPAEQDTDLTPLLAATRILQADPHHARATSVLVASAESRYAWSNRSWFNPGCTALLRTYRDPAHPIRQAAVRMWSYDKDHVVARNLHDQEIRQVMMDQPASVMTTAIGGTYRSGSSYLTTVSERFGDMPRYELGKGGESLMAISVRPKLGIPLRNWLRRSIGYNQMQAAMLRLSMNDDALAADAVRLLSMLDREQQADPVEPATAQPGSQADYLTPTTASG